MHASGRFFKCLAPGAGWTWDLGSPLRLPSSGRGHPPLPGRKHRSPAAQSSPSRLSNQRKPPLINPVRVTPLTRSGSRGPWGPGPPLPLRFLQNHAVLRQFLGKNPYFWTNFGLRVPPWGQNSAGKPLTTILDPRLLAICYRRKACPEKVLSWIVFLLGSSFSSLDAFVFAQILSFRFIACNTCSCKTLGFFVGWSKILFTRTCLVRINNKKQKQKQKQNTHTHLHTHTHKQRSWFLRVDVGEFFFATELGKFF